MQDKLAKFGKDYGIEWQEYTLDELFNKIVQGRRLKKQDQIKGDLPFVMSGTTNTGIASYIGNQVRIFPSNSLTIDIFGNVFYRGYEYGMGDDTGAYWNTGSEIPKAAMLYIGSTIKKRLEGRFDYGNKLRSSQSLGVKILLPTKNRKICFHYMEQFIATIEQELIANLKSQLDGTLKAYLETTGLDDYELTEEEKNLLNSLRTMSWKEFKIENVLNWQRNIAEINPLHLDSLSVSNEPKYPFYGQATVNNGIIQYCHLDDKVLNNKLGHPTILIHSNNQNVVYLDTPFYLKDGHGATSVLQSSNLDEITARFLMTSIKKVILQKYNYNAKATKIELKNTMIALPVTHNEKPDYECMSLIISAIQKVVIKDLVSALDERVKATESVIST